MKLEVIFPLILYHQKSTFVVNFKNEKEKKYIGNYL